MVAISLQTFAEMFSADTLIFHFLSEMASKTTLKYIAGQLQLSISTVSRALKDHPDIAAATKKKVVQLANLIDYEPNTNAINLRTNASKLFAILVPGLINNNFYYSFLSAVEELSRKAGYSLLILQTADDPEIEAQSLRLARMNRVAGIFVALTKHTRDLAAFRKIEESGIPVIFFDKVPDIDSCNKIRVADEEASKLAAERLIRSERKNILALFGNPDLQITRKRAAVMQERLLKGAPTARLQTFYADSFEEAHKATREALISPHPPDAVFAMSDEILTGVMKAILQVGRKVPAETAVIAISNDGYIPGLYEPSITYVETSGTKLGKLAFERMKDYLAGKHFYRELISPSLLIEGGSI